MQQKSMKEKVKEYFENLEFKEYNDDCAENQYKELKTVFPKIILDDIVIMSKQDKNSNKEEKVIIICMDTEAKIREEENKELLEKIKNKFDILFLAKYEKYNDIQNPYIVFELYTKNNIDSLATYFEELNSLDLVLNNHRYYRGHSSVDYKLIPFIYRDKYINKESELFHEAIIRNCDEFPKSMSTFDKLVKMQHYGLPTRLLDITESPLTALYFAVKPSEKEKNYNDISDKEIREILLKKAQKDCAVYVFDIPKKDIKYYDSDSVCVISNLVKQKSDYTIKKLMVLSKQTKAIPYQKKYNHRVVKRINKHQNITILLHDIDDDKPGFVHRIWPETLTSVFCVKAKMENKRIIRQDGAFLLFGMKEKKTECADLPYYPIKIIIEQENKENILNELKQYAIDEQHLFPEIEKSFEYIKEHIENL